MARVAKQLTVLEVKTLKSPPTSRAVGGVPGLLLQFSENGKFWVLRTTTGVTPQGKQRRQEFGLGAYSDVTLAQARETAADLLKQIRNGHDPIATKRRLKEEKVAEITAVAVAGITFKDAAIQFIAMKSPEWKSAVHLQQWENTLATYAYPRIGNMPIQVVDTAAVRLVLDPIWRTITETADRVRGRIAAILGWAIAGELRTGPNPAEWNGHLEHLLPSPAQIAPKKHFPALPYARIPSFIKALRSRGGTGARMLEFTILTATRTNEVRLAPWTEIDFKNKIWIIPGKRMKGKKGARNDKDHRVPLSSTALRILSRIPTNERKGLLFPAEDGKSFSNAVMTRLIQKMHTKSLRDGGDGYLDPAYNRIVTTHGFRSSFTDWAGDIAGYPKEMWDLALSHEVGDKVEASYRRSDMLAKRHRMMEEWAEYIEG